MKILLATDGSDSARAAVDFLIRFPFPGDSSTTLLAVIDAGLFAEDESTALNDDQNSLLKETEQTVREDAVQLLTGEAERLREAGWTVVTEIRTGDPAEEIIQAAEATKPDLVVVGSHGIMGVKHFLLGSVSGRVLEHACCSVLIVKASSKLSMPPGSEEEARPWRILLAYDDSAPARKAAALCATLPLNERAEVAAISVMPMVHMYRQDVRQHLNTIWQQKKRAAETALQDAVDNLPWSTPHVRAELKESSDVSREILDTATKNGSDLVVLGYKGTTAIKRFLLGSITGRIARHAPCSVLAVRNWTTE